MPVIQARLREEQTIINKLKRLAPSRRKELVKLLGDPPDIKNVPESFWKKIEDEDAALLLLLLIGIHKGGSTAVSQQAQFDLDKEVIQREAEKYAERRIKELVPKSVKNSRKLVTDIVNRKAKVGETLKQKDLETVFGQTRAEGLAVTETTAGTAHGEMTVARTARRSKKNKVLVIWRVDPLSNVCSICKRLNGKPERVWKRTYPDGPPGHPICACYLEVIINGVSAGRFLPGLERVPDTEMD